MPSSLIFSNHLELIHLIVKLRWHETFHLIIIIALIVIVNDNGIFFTVLLKQSINSCLLLYKVVQSDTCNNNEHLSN